MRVRARSQESTPAFSDNLVDGKGNSQNITLSNTAITHLLGAVFQKRMQDPTKDFFLDEAIPLAGLASFELPSGHTGLRMHLNQQEVFDVVFAPDVQRGLSKVFRFLADRSDQAANR